MALEPNGVQQNGETTSPQQQQTPVEASGSVDKNKSARHPRWTRQETLILVEAKMLAENRVRKGRRSGSVFGPDQLEPKWDYVSSYCKQHEVNRGPVQCRKRWSNIVGDFKKIKAWEESQEGEKSYWMMRNDLRKESKLPGYFDKEVFDVLDGSAFTATKYQLALVTISANGKNGDEVEEVVAEGVEEEEDEDEEAIFDSARLEDGLFSDSEKLGHSQNKIPAPKPISEMRYQPFNPSYSNQGTTKEQQPGTPFWKEFYSQEGCKRRRVSLDECCDINLGDRLIKVIDNCANMLNAQVESHNKNRQLDRNQQKDYNENLVAALNKITDALIKIVDKR